MVLLMLVTHDERRQLHHLVLSAAAPDKLEGLQLPQGLHVELFDCPGDEVLVRKLLLHVGKDNAALLR